MIKFLRYYPGFVSEPDEYTHDEVQTADDFYNIEFVQRWKNYSGFIEYRQHPLSKAFKFEDFTYIIYAHGENRDLIIGFTDQEIPGMKYHIE